MQLSDEKKEQLLARHFTLMKLVKYIECSTENFIGFLKNTFLFEKNIETGKDPAYAQSSMFRELLRSELHLKKILLSQEWQQASEYFVVPHNASDLLEFFSQIESGALVCESKAFEIRRKLIQEAFFTAEKSKGKARYNRTLFHFVFHEETPPWTAQSIEWEVEESQGEQCLVGQPVISLGVPKPDGPEIYRNLYALTGSEKKAACILMIHSLLTQNLSLKTTAEEILDKIDLGSSRLKDWMDQAPFELKRAFAKWAKENTIEQELSTEGLCFLANAMAYLEQNESPGYAYLKNRIEGFGLELEIMDKPVGYDFSNFVPKGGIVIGQARIKYYWPQENRWELVVPGKCCLSAGAVPLFLQEIEKLTQLGELEPREEDFHAVKELLLYIQLGDKVTKPPMLPIYNALRRWMENLASKESYKAIENLCEHAKVFRPHIQIPAVGEKPFSISNREHKLISRLALDQKPGVIIGIKQAGIIVPGDKMPLCLPGSYWIARQHSQIEHLIEMTSSFAMEEEEIRKAWQNLSQEENCEDLLLILKKLLRDIPGLEENLWQTIQKTILEFNLRGGKDRIFFLASKKITVQEFKDMESNREFRVKIAHSAKLEEGTIVSQEPGTEYCSVVIASGISPRLLQAIQNLYNVIKQKKGKENKKIEAIRCNLLSFLLENCQNGEIAELLSVSQEYAEEFQVKEELQIVRKWLES